MRSYTYEMENQKEKNVDVVFDASVVAQIKLAMSLN
jgi:hypothetical protein